MNPSWLDEFPARITALDQAHLRRKRAVVTPDSGARLMVDGHSLLAFCSNDYLGLSTHPELIQAAREGALAYGVGSGGSPLVSGHSAANEALEHELAAFVGLPRAVYFYAGFSANAGGCRARRFTATRMPTWPRWSASWRTAAPGASWSSATPSSAWTALAPT